MTVLNTVAFLLMLTGSFLLLGISIKEMASRIYLPLLKRKQFMRNRVETARGGHQLKGLPKLLEEAQNQLRNTGKENQFMTVCLISMFLSVVGASIGMMTANLFLVPILGYGMALMPFWYIMLTANSYKKHVNEELETALSIITTSYLRSENLLMAIEENLTYLNPPVYEVFAGFMAQTRLINANVRMALEWLKSQLENEVFKEWCDAMMACSGNRNLKSVILLVSLSAVVKLSKPVEYRR